MATTPKRKPSNAALADIPSIDVIGLDGRARVVGRLLAPYQEARAELTVIQSTNKLGDDDLIPGAPASASGVPTFAQRRSELLALEQDIYASAEPRVLERLRELVEQG